VRLATVQHLMLPRKRVLEKFVIGWKIKQRVGVKRQFFWSVIGWIWGKIVLAENNQENVTEHGFD
jgi:hypothetical protein